MEKLDEAMEVLRSSGYLDDHDEQTASLILGRFFAQNMASSKNLEAYIKRIFGLDGNDKAEIYLTQRYGKKYGIFVANKSVLGVFVNSQYVMLYYIRTMNLKVVGGYDERLLGTVLGMLPWPNNPFSRAVAYVYDRFAESLKKEDKPAQDGCSGRDGESNVRSMDESKKESETQAKRFVKPRGW